MTKCVFYLVDHAILSKRRYRSPLQHWRAMRRSVPNIVPAALRSMDLWKQGLCSISLDCHLTSAGMQSQQTQPVILPQQAFDASRLKLPSCHSRHAMPT